MKSIKEYILDVIQESYIFEMAYDRKEITTSSKIASIIRIKFRTENIIINNDICDSCIENLKYVIELISNDENDDNTDKIYDYVEQL